MNNDWFCINTPLAYKMSNLIYLPILVIFSFLFLALLIKKPWIATYILVLTIWLSPLSAFNMTLTPNRILGLIAVGIIIGNKVLDINTQKLKFSPFDYAIWIYLLTILMSLVSHQPSETTKVLLSDMLAGYILYWVALNTIRTPKTLDIILWIIVLTSTILSVSIAIEAFENIALNVNRFGGMLQVNEASSQIAAAIPILFLFLLKGKGKVSKLFLAVNMLICVLAVFLTGSRSGLLLLACILFAVLGWFFRAPDRTVFVALATLFSVIFLGYSVLVNYFPQVLDRGLYNFIPTVFGETGGMLSQYPEIRFELQRVSWQIFLSDPLAGIGFGNTQVESYKFSLLAGIARDHNFFTGVLAETGVLGFLAVIFVLMAIYRILLKAYRSSISALHKSYIFFIAISFTVYCVVDLTTHGTQGFGNKAWFIIAFISMLAANLYSEPTIALQDPNPRALPQSYKHQLQHLDFLKRTQSTSREKH